MNGVQFLHEYYRNPGRYLPLIDHAQKTFTEPDPTHDDVNIGWNCGLIAPNRPYFSECWAIDGVTMLTILLSAEGLEDFRDEQVEELCEQNRCTTSTRAAQKPPSCRSSTAAANCFSQSMWLSG